MLPRIVDAEARNGYRVWVEFADGTAGEIDLAGELWGEVFDRLREPAEFAQVGVDVGLGTLVWPNGADFAPEFLYQALCPGYRLGGVSESGIDCEVPSP
jgi:hypothetical protein